MTAQNVDFRGPPREEISTVPPTVPQVDYFRMRRQGQGKEARSREFASCSVHTTGVKLCRTDWPATCSSIRTGMEIPVGSWIL
jgi:hypothetical protein